MSLSCRTSRFGFFDTIMSRFGFTTLLLISQLLICLLITGSDFEVEQDGVCTCVFFSVFFSRPNRSSNIGNFSIIAYVKSNTFVCTES